MEKLYSLIDSYYDSMVATLEKMTAALTAPRASRPWPRSWATP